MILSQSNTLSEDINAARLSGFTSDFMFRNNQLFCRNSNKYYNQQDCLLVEYCRHEGLNDPDDASILFLIQCTDNNKGCLTSAYGVDADAELMDFVKSLKKLDR